MTESLNESLNQSLNESLNESMTESMNESRNESLNESLMWRLRIPGSGAYGSPALTVAVCDRGARGLTTAPAAPARAVVPLWWSVSLFPD